MDKGQPQDAAPPYPGPPMNYGGPMPQPGFAPTAPPVGYQGGLSLYHTLKTTHLYSQTYFM